MRLSELKAGQTAVITSVKAQPQYRKRLRALGFVRGEEVACTDISLGGGLMAFSVQGAKLALRKKDAMRIGVRR